MLKLIYLLFIVSIYNKLIINCLFTTLQELKSNSSPKKALKFFVKVIIFLQTTIFSK